MKDVQKIQASEALLGGFPIDFHVIFQKGHVNGKQCVGARSHEIVGGSRIESPEQAQGNPYQIQVESSIRRKATNLFSYSQPPKSSTYSPIGVNNHWSYTRYPERKFCPRHLGSALLAWNILCERLSKT